MTEQELAEVRRRNETAGLIDVELLLKAIDERDAIIHDLMIDGQHLAKAAAGQTLARAHDRVFVWLDHATAKTTNTDNAPDVSYLAGECAAYKKVLQYLTERASACGTTHDPLPPDQVRQECERLRQQIDELLSGCGSHSCKVQRPHGQGVNGPCRCVEKLRAARGEEYTP